MAKGSAKSSGLTRKRTQGSAAMARIAIVNADRCRPRKCNRECVRSCPVHQMGTTDVIVAKKTSKSCRISEELCTGCGQCVRACPFKAIRIINLPKDLEQFIMHRFGPNAFRLHRLPVPRREQVLGLVGTNGIGKSTCLQILGGKLRPNLGEFEGEGASWKSVLDFFRGSELQLFMKDIVQKKSKSVLKPQYVDKISASLKGAGSTRTIADAIAAAKARVPERVEELVDLCDLQHLLHRAIVHLSGGELQRFAILIAAVSDVNVFIFDEPTSYLDIRQRLRASRVIRGCASIDKAYCIVVEHDLAVLDYMSDFVCVLYGIPGAYGVVSHPFSVREGINVFLAGFIRTENMRFRDHALNFRVTESTAENTDAEIAQKEAADVKASSGADDGSSDAAAPAEGGGGEKKRRRRSKRKKTDGGDGGDKDEDGTKAGKEEKEEEPEPTVEDEKAIAERVRKQQLFHYPDMKKTQGEFVLNVREGYFMRGEIIVLLGQNGCGKTTLIRLLAGLSRADGMSEPVTQLNVSFKPQKIAPKFGGTVRELLSAKLGSRLSQSEFETTVLKDMMMEPLWDRLVKQLSGGELQRVAIVLALGKPADCYLLDEPSAYLDSEQRLLAARVIRRHIINLKKTGFIVEHDFIMATYLADRVIVYSGEAGVNCTASPPKGLLEGMNEFLRDLEITFRRDPESHRPRINKHMSQKDTEQKAAGNYFFMVDDHDE